MKHLLRLLPKRYKERFIPDGYYCYTYTGKEWRDADGRPHHQIKVCPFWERLDIQFPEGAGVAIDCFGVGYCHYLKQSDLDMWYHPTLVYADGKEIPEEEQHEEEDITWFGLLWDQCKECGVRERE